MRDEKGVRPKTNEEYLEEIRNGYDASAPQHTWTLKPQPSPTLPDDLPSIYHATDPLAPNQLTKDNH